MKNEQFITLEKEKKRKKIMGVIREKSSRYLTDMEIESIVDSLDIERQYSIKLCLNIDDYHSVTITEDKTESTIYLIGQYFEPTTVIVHPKDKVELNQIYIIVPPCRLVSTIHKLTTM